MIDDLGAALAPAGLNLIGVAPVGRYDAGMPPERGLARLLPAAASAVVIGNGGRAFWDAASAAGEGGPDPLDRFTRRTIEAVALPLARSALGDVRVVYPFEFPACPISFVRLAAAAGLGRPSLLGVLIHPVYGPWMALRAAIVTRAALVAARPADGFDPCPTCRERSCVAACPAGAVTDAGWSIPRCAAHRARDDDPCAWRCHARHDCVVGRAHRYPAAAFAHHQAHARPALAAAR